MANTLLTLPLRTQEDVLLTRRRARDLAGLLQFSAEQQIGLSTAVWEVARLAEGHGEVELAVLEAATSVAVRVTISGLPSSVLGDDSSRPRLDVAALRRLVGAVETRDDDDTAAVCLSAAASPDTWLPGVDDVELVLRSLTRHDVVQGGLEIVDELHQQNFDLLTALSTLRDREGELVRLNAELEDTNRAVTALYTELEQQAADLRERAAATARFLNELTHELRTPLYAARGMTEAILRDHPDDLDAGLRDDVTLIDGAMVEALELVNDHLDLAKLAAGRMTVRLSRVDVAELLATVRAIITRLPVNEGVEVVVEDAAQLPSPHTDAFKLSQILRNFIVNAMKFTEAGEIRVSAAVTRDGEALRFAVADTGVGLSEEDQTRVFEDFVQLAPERAGRVRGTGLGLPLTRRLAAVLGGEVTVRSAPGQGSTFGVVIPLRFPTGRAGITVVDEG
jgi:signal transduction histidine kinase